MEENWTLVDLQKPFGREGGAAELNPARVDDSMSADLDVRIRRAGPGDFAFIADTYIRTRLANERRGCKNNKVFCNAARHRLLFLLNRAGASMACAAEDPTHFFGWSICEHGLVQFVYVKAPYRGLGIASALVLRPGARPDTGPDALLCAHWSASADSIALAHPGLLHYIGTDIPEAMKEYLHDPSS